MSKAISVFSLLATPQKSHRVAIATLTAITSLITQASYAGCPAGQSVSPETGQCMSTVTVTGQRAQKPGNCDYGWQWDFSSQKCVSTTPTSAAGQAYNESNSNQAGSPSASNTNNSPWPEESNSNGSVTVTDNKAVNSEFGGANKQAIAEFIGAKRPGEGDKGAQQNSDKCKTSVGIDGKLQCDSTYRFMDNAKLANQLTNASGNAAVTASGTVANIKAQDAGTQSAVAEAQASTMEKAGALQTLSGLANVALGAWQVKLALKHKDNEDKVLPQKEAEQAALAKQYQASIAAGTPMKLPDGYVPHSASEFKAAKDEQNKTQQDAMAQGALAILQGGQQAAAGAMEIAAAKQAKELAGKLSNTTGTSYQITSANPTDLTNTGTTSTAINPGTAPDPAVATTDGTIKANDVPNITPPVNPDATSGGPGGGPVAGGFTPGNPQSAGGGGGNPGIGVGSMQAAKGDPEPTGPRMADTKGNSSYAQGSGAGFAAGGGVSAEKSADLGFLANLLPKPQEEMAKNGILDYGGGRSPASMAPYSFLGKDVNIFQRISDRTTAKFKSGDVGRMGGS